jgi:hypothetical protein
MMNGTQLDGTQQWHYNIENNIVLSAIYVNGASELIKL